MQGAGGSGAPQLRFDPEGDPLFLTHHPNWTLPALEIVPVGLVFRALRAGAPLPAPAIPTTSSPARTTRGCRRTISPAT